MSALPAGLPNLTLANDDRFAASVGPFQPSTVNYFDPFARRSAKETGVNFSLGAPMVLGIGALLLIGSFLKR